ncbi:MAG: carboxylating nicotinate-nucleotide diphosphorylase [Gammaproteobacteria bacterium]
MQIDYIDKMVTQTLEEDIGSGDLTASLIPESSQSQAKVIVRERATICGTLWFNRVFAQLDDQVQVNWKVKDGDVVSNDQTLCTITGPSRSILTGERTALNFLQTLSATATAAASYVKLVEDLPATILDTRKTVPGLRQAQKYATRIGGCTNHRIGLYDGILIKENHILACGSIGQAVKQAKLLSNDYPVEVEVENLEELQQAIDAIADIIMLDNFTLPDMSAAVTLNAGCAKLEASGGVSLETVRAIAETGVDFISVGSLTKDIKAIDLSMRFDDKGASD